MGSFPQKTDWRLADFDFDLPPELIALRPVEPRDTARLLVAGETVSDQSVGDLPSLLEKGDILVFNDTKVIAAQLTAMRGDLEVHVTLHQPLKGGQWTAFARPGKRLRMGQELVFAGGVEGRILAKRQDGEIVLSLRRDGRAFDDAGGFATWLDHYGAMPLPPYIAARRKIDARDREDYQTMFANRPGAIAAPTAGLHFTPALLAALDAAGIKSTRITLNVGAGTFLPVRADDLSHHRMYKEWGQIEGEAATAINTARLAGKRVVAVGTTCLRILETVADPAGQITPWQGETDLFITPGYRFRCVDRLLTNFHLPRSTLFILVCAFAGWEKMRDIYAHACGLGYRFYSYGDACLLSCADQS